MDIACPDCGERERMTGIRNGQTIELVCDRCGVRWERDPTLRCRLCGSDTLRYTPRPLWERGRGEQRTPAGRIDAYSCDSCGGRDVTSSHPTPGEGA